MNTEPKLSRSVNLDVLLSDTGQSKAKDDISVPALALQVVILITPIIYIFNWASERSISLGIDILHQSLTLMGLAT